MPAPLRSVTAARVYDETMRRTRSIPAASSSTRASPALSFRALVDAGAGRDAAGIEIDVSVGYGDAASAIPAALRQAIRLLVAHWYENRGLIAFGQTIAVMPAATAALIAPFRVLAL